MQGNIDDDGYVNNLDQLKKPLETIDETKKKKVLDMKQKADKILNKVEGRNYEKKHEQRRSEKTE